MCVVCDLFVCFPCVSIPRVVFSVCFFLVCVVFLLFAALFSCLSMCACFAVTVLVCGLSLFIFLFFCFACLYMFPNAFVLCVCFGAGCFPVFVLFALCMLLLGLCCFRWCVCFMDLCLMFVCSAAVVI